MATAQIWTCGTVSTVGGARGQFEIQDLLHAICMRNNVPSYFCISVTAPVKSHTSMRLHLDECVHKLPHAPALLVTLKYWGFRVRTPARCPPFIFRDVSGTVKLNPLVTFSAHLQFNGAGCDALGCTWQVNS